MSRQTDVIIYDAMNCPAYRTSEIAAIIPSDNVAATVEVKSVLDKEQMHDAFTKASVIKGLSKTKPPNVPMPMMCQTLCFLFAFESALTLDKLWSIIMRCYSEFDLGRHIDLVMILDRGVIMLAGKARQQGPLISGWAPMMMEGLGGSAGEGARVAVSCARDKGQSRYILPFFIGGLNTFQRACRASGVLD